MSGRETGCRAARSIGGAVLIALGMFILSENVAAAVGELKCILGANGLQTLGILPALVLAVSRELQAYAADHHGFLQNLREHGLILPWPLVLLRIGTFLSRRP